MQEGRDIAVKSLGKPELEPVHRYSVSIPDAETALRVSNPSCGPQRAYTRGTRLIGHRPLHNRFQVSIGVCHPAARAGTLPAK